MIDFFPVADTGLFDMFDVWNSFRFKTTQDKELDKTTVVYKICQATICQDTTNLRIHLTRNDTMLTLPSDNKLPEPKQKKGKESLTLLADSLWAIKL